MNEDIGFKIIWAAKLCASADSLLAMDCKRGVLALERVIAAMDGFGLHGNPRVEKRIGRLRVLRSALVRAGTDRAADALARKAVLVMWEALYAIRQASGFGWLAATIFAWKNRLRPAAGAVLVALVIVCCIGYGRSWIERDAASAIAYDFMRGNPAGVTLMGIHDVEHDANGSWRWVEGPKACLKWDMPMSREVLLHLEASNPILHQEVKITLNGSPIVVVRDVPVKGWERTAMQLDKALTLERGSNALCFETRDYNHFLTTFAPTDQTPYAFAIMALRLTVYP